LGAIAAALATTALVLASSGNNSAVAASSVVNGNFETGDLTGWTVDTTNGGGANATNSYNYWRWGEDWWVHLRTMFPQEGSYFALLQSGNQQSDVTKISQPIEASNGDKVSGWVFLNTDSMIVPSGDKGQVVIKSDSGTTLATPFEEYIQVGGDPYWRYWEYTFSGLTGAGQFQIEAQLQNTGKIEEGYAEDHSVMGLDDVKTTAAPDNDITAPDTTVISGPNGPTNNTAPTFTFSGSDDVTITANLNYQYRLDSGGWSAASISTTANLTSLSEGAHLFKVRAVDEAGNVDGSPAQRSFTVDTTKPTVIGTTPLRGATNVGRGTNSTAPFSEKMSTSSVNTTTFKLFKVNPDGTQTRITDVVVSLSSDGLTATLNPFGTKTTLLARNTKYKGVISTGTKDLAGNSLAQQKSWTFITKP